MDDIKEIKSDVKEIRVDVVVIKETMAVNTANLQAHMRRTDLNEARLAKLEYWLIGLLTTLLVAVAVGHLFPKK